MQVIYDFWSKLFGNEQPKKAKKPMQPPVDIKANSQKTNTEKTHLERKQKPTPPKNPIFQIQRKQINENSFTDTVDGEKYIVNYGETTITITSSNGSKKTINIEQLMQSSTPEEQKKMMNHLREQNAGILFDFATETGYAHYFPEGYNKEGSYTPAFEELQINPNSLNHELIHALDNYDNNGRNWKSFSDRSEYIKTVKEEFSKFSDSNEIFVSRINGEKLIINNVAEVFAECGVLITSGGQLSYNEDVIKKYFPKTLMLTRKYIDEARKLPQEKRMNAKIEIQNNQDGSINYTRLTKEGKPISTIKFDKNVWPYSQSPYSANYDENGILVKEIINEIFYGNVADQTVKTFDPKTKTKTIKIIDVNPYTDETIKITEETIKQEPFSHNIHIRDYEDNKLTKETFKKLNEDESQINEKTIFYNSNNEQIKKVQKTYK